MHCIFLCARVPYFGFLICVASHARIACFAYDRLETGLNTNPVRDGLKVDTDGRYCFMVSPRRLKTTFSRNIDHRLFYTEIAARNQLDTGTLQTLRWKRQLATASQIPKYNPMWLVVAQINAMHSPQACVSIYLDTLLEGVEKQKPRYVVHYCYCHSFMS